MEMNSAFRYFLVFGTFVSAECQFTYDFVCPKTFSIIKMFNSFLYKQNFLCFNARLDEASGLIFSTNLGALRTMVEIVKILISF